MWKVISLSNRLVILESRLWTSWSPLIFHNKNPTSGIFLVSISRKSDFWGEKRECNITTDNKKPSKKRNCYGLIYSHGRLLCSLKESGLKLKEEAKILW